MLLLDVIAHYELDRWCGCIAPLLKAKLHLPYETTANICYHLRIYLSRLPNTRTNCKLNLSQSAASGSDEAVAEVGGYAEDGGQGQAPAQRIGPDRVHHVQVGDGLVLVQAHQEDHLQTGA